MTTGMELLLGVFLLTTLCLAGASRLLHCIRLAAWQGIVIGLYPLVTWDWSVSHPSWHMILIALFTLLIKGVLLPKLLRRAMYRAGVRRELEPLVGYAISLFIVLAASALFAVFSNRFLALAPGGLKLMAPVAFTGIFTGLFLIVARRKAITQAIGFLTFENGITLFGLGMAAGCSWIVEFGILLDVFVLIFVMGITVFHIRCEFAHIDADRMHLLHDNPVPEKEEKR